jgi:nucleotide-binding universal stress UspA family protein
MKVLLATDGSEYSEGAARFLTRLTLSKKDEIIVFYVISEVPYDDDYSAQVKRVIKRVAPKILHDTAQIVKPLDASIVTVEEEGYPDTTIIEKAVDYGADLIMMGARGVKGVQILFLGSATRAVTINSPVPVLIFKRPPWKASGTMKVIFATDGSETADAAGKFLASFPLPAETEITVMHTAYPFVDIPEKYLKEIGEELNAKPSTYEESERIFADTQRHLAGFKNIDYLLRSRPDRNGMQGVKGNKGNDGERLQKDTGQLPIVRADRKTLRKGGCQPTSFAFSLISVPASATETGQPFFVASASS